MLAAYMHSPFQTQQEFQLGPSQEELAAKAAARRAQLAAAAAAADEDDVTAPRAQRPGTAPSGGGGGKGGVGALQQPPRFKVGDTLAARLKAEAVRRGLEEGRFESEAARWVPVI